MATSDPLVLRVVEVTDDGFAAVHTVRRSAPTTVLSRSTMRVRDVTDAGVLVAGPRAPDSARRRQRTAHLGDLLLYLARRADSRAGERDVRFDGREIVALVAEDEEVPREQARAMLRDALAALGGREITNPYERDEIGYVIPTDVVRPPA